MTIILTTSSAGKITETMWLKRKIRKMTKKMVGFKDEIDQAGKNITNIQVTIHVCYQFLSFLNSRNQNNQKYRNLSKLSSPIPNSILQNFPKKNLRKFR